MLFVCVLCVRVVLVAQWIRHPPTKREIAGSSPVEDSLFSFSFIFSSFHLLFFVSIVSVVLLCLCVFRVFVSPVSVVLLCLPCRRRRLCLVRPCPFAAAPSLLVSRRTLAT